MKYLFKTALCVLVTLVSACSSDEFIEEQTEIKQIVMNASDFEYEQDSRTILTPTPTGAKFTWAENDTVGIFPDKGRQVDFSMKAGAGTNSASFGGGGWALKPSSTYAAYYPLQGKFYLDMTAIPVSYEGQTQKGNGSTSHLGKYDFMAAAAATPTEGNVNFNFKHLGCIVRFVITFPTEKPVSEISGITMYAKSNLFTTQGTINLKAATPTIEPVTKNSSIKVGLENVSLTSENKTITAYMMMAPADLTGQNLDLSVGGYFASIEGKKFEAQKTYQYKVVLKENTAPTDLWVDLGLSVKWAARNLGAANTEASGNFFAWGEIEPKDNYNYASSVTMNKHMGSIAGNAQYDAATAAFGDQVHTPTSAEIEELFNNTNYEWTTHNGVEGYKFTSKQAGNSSSIFIPAAGYKRDLDLIEAGTNVWLWSATPHESRDNFSYALRFSNNASPKIKQNMRYFGLPIRPVRTK